MLISTDPSAHKLTLEPDNSDSTHYCYRPLIEPYASDANSASLQLVPPIPQEGTLLIAHTEGGDYFFSLRIDEGRIVYQYTIDQSSTGTLSLATDLDLSNTTYQIDLNTTSNSAELVLSRVDEEGGVATTEVVERGEVVAVDTYPGGAVFSTVCVGGSLLEYLNYAGTIRSAFYGFNSLLEERNFCPLEIEGVGRSDLIVFVDNDVPRSLTFERSTLNNSIVSFEARLPLINQGALMILESDRYILRLTTIGTDGVLFPQVEDLESSKVWFNQICISPVFDDEWHSFVITSNFSDEANPSVNILIDGISCLISSTIDFGSTPPLDINEPLLTFANLPLSFGTTHDSVAMGGVPSTFHGCINNFEIQRTLDPGVVFRPNLEALPRESSEFDISSCYHCDSKNMACAGSLVCTDRGFGLAAECECPEGFTGEDCGGECCHGD